MELICSEYFDSVLSKAKDAILLTVVVLCCTLDVLMFIGVVNFSFLTVNWKVDYLASPVMLVVRLIIIIVIFLCPSAQSRGREN